MKNHIIQTAILIAAMSVAGSVAHARVIKNSNDALGEIVTRHECKVIDIDPFPNNRRCSAICEDGITREQQPCSANMGDIIIIYG